KRIERKLAHIKGEGENVQLYLNEAARITSDEELFDEYALDPGFTKPIALAPPTNLFKRGN
ncbi:hypothetical protein, partial [Escherichia coli]|uniref:hypothetical protein n=1 Tax=Escherichia coli TaxID=562 RepID=UPI0019601435